MLREDIDPRATSEALDRLAAQLDQEGHAAEAAELRRIREVVLQPARPDESLLTTGEAAKALGIRSVNTIKRWVRDGLLDGYARGGRILVTSASVQRLLHSPTIAEQRAYDQRLDEAFAPFDAPDEPIDLDQFHTSQGRKPWEASEVPTEAAASRRE